MNMKSLKGDSTLIEALRRAAKRPMTEDEVRQQKISFILGSLSEDSTISRKRVEEELDKNSGTRQKS